MGGRGSRQAGALVAALMAVLVIAVGVPLNVVSGYFPTTVTIHRTLWTGLLAGGVAVVAALTLLSRRLDAAGPSLPLPPELTVPGWAVGRPAEVEAVARALTGKLAATVGITTGLYGAGGFGKTTLARMACADRRVRQRFGGRVYLVTLGRDVRGAAAIAAKVNDVIKLVASEEATFTDPEIAGQRLGALLDAGPRRLLVVDDVWESEQLAPFVVGGGRCARLVTTRVPDLLPDRDRQVQVDQMTAQQARLVLTWGLTDMDPALVDGLLTVTGRWPLLLRLVNKILANAAQAGACKVVGASLLKSLQAGGPAAVDDLSGEETRSLDVGQPQERARAVRATIEASTSLLDAQDTQRFYEMGVFAEDEAIPFTLVAALWNATAQLGEMQCSQLAARLLRLALVSATGSGGFTLHDVIRDFIRAELGSQQLANTNQALLDLKAAELPSAAPVPGAAKSQGDIAWWKIAASDRYLWDHLIEHQLDANRQSDAETLAADLRWVGARLERFGPASPTADLALVGTPRAARLSFLLARVAHLLAPTQPAGAVIDVLHSRIADDPDWGPQASALREAYHRPRLVNRWPIPDQADPALRRVMSNPYDWMTAVAVAPDGGWLAAGSSDGVVRIWNVADGRERAALTGHKDWVTAMAVAPDGTWLATGGDDATIRIWDVADARERATLACGKHRVTAVAVAPDGTWLAASSGDGMVWIWDVGERRVRVKLASHRGTVTSVVVAPDGRWLAAGGADGTVRIWDVADARERAALACGNVRVTALAVAPDGTWLAASSGFREQVRIWDVSTWRQRSPLAVRPQSVSALEVAPDGSWIVTAGYEGTLRIWDVASGHERAALTGHIGSVTSVATSSDGNWLASASQDRTVRIWDVPRQERPRGSSRNDSVSVITAASDGSWLLTKSSNGTVRIWDPVTGSVRSTITTRIARGSDAAIAILRSDGSRLASTEGFGDPVRIWDATTGREQATLPGPGDYNVSPAMTASPDGSWLAVRGYDGAVKVWDVTKSSERASVPDSPDWKIAMTAAPDSSWLAIGGYDGATRIWDGTTGRECATLARHIGSVTSVAVSPDGSWLATGGGDDGTVHLWDTATWKHRATLRGHSGRHLAVAISHDGAWIATGSDQTLRVWDVRSNRVEAMMRVENSILACAWVDPYRLAAGGPAGLYLFDFLI